MKIAHKDVQVGDVLLMAKNAKLTVIKVIKITKSGSLKYSFYSEDYNGPNPYYSASLELNVEKHNRILYFQRAYKPELDQYFWLLKRNE